MVVSERCFRNDPSSYMSCEYYVDPPSERRSDLSGFVSRRKVEFEKASFLSLVHALPTPVKSECPYFSYVEKGALHAAYCHALDRFLGRHEVWRCVKYWRTCPIARIHRSIVEERG